MKFEDFIVGDILSCTRWDRKYQVIDIDEDTKDIRLQDMECLSDSFWWHFYAGYTSINIERDPNFVNKTPIERKIAHLYKLFEERKIK